MNFANGDMVGHTGVIPAVIQAIETVDTCLGQIIGALDATWGSALIIADHGNAEEEIDALTGGVMTAHTTNPVPCVLVTPESSEFRHIELRPDAALSSVAPTILELLGLQPPASMTSPSRSTLISIPDGLTKTDPIVHAFVALKGDCIRVFRSPLSHALNEFLRGGRKASAVNDA